MLDWLFGRRPAVEAAVRPASDAVIDDEGGGDDDDTADYPTGDFERGRRGGLKLLMAAPNVQFVVGVRSATMMRALEDLGFEFRVRPVGMAEIASVAGPVAVEVASVEELLALQRRIGLPIKIEEGMLEIVA